MHGENEVNKSINREVSEEADINNDVRVNKIEKYENKEKSFPPKKERSSSDTTIFRGALMITNLCIGVSIFAFAIRATYFGHFWFIITGIIVGIINYWSLMLCVIASSKNKEDDYSELTEKILGKKFRIFLNVIIIIYSYAILMMFMVLTYSLLGRFIQAVGYINKYQDYDEFNDEIWSKPYIKFPVYIGLTIGLGFMCLIKDMNKLNFSSYIGVLAVIYSLCVVLIQCHLSFLF